MTKHPLVPAISRGEAVSEAEPELENTILALVLPRTATIYWFFPLGEGKKSCAGVVPFSPAQRGAGLPHCSRPASPICATICDHPVHDTSPQPPSQPSPCSWDISHAQKPQIYKPLPRTSLHQLNQPLSSHFPGRPAALRGGRGLPVFCLLRAQLAAAPRSNLTQANTCGQHRSRAPQKPWCSLSQAQQLSCCARQCRGAQIPAAPCRVRDENPPP